MKEGTPHDKHRWPDNATTDFHTPHWSLGTILYSWFHQPSVKQGVKQPSSPLSSNMELAKQHFRQQIGKIWALGSFIWTPRVLKGFSQGDVNGKTDGSPRVRLAWRSTVACSHPVKKCFWHISAFSEVMFKGHQVACRICTCTLKRYMLWAKESII